MMSEKTSANSSISCQFWRLVTIAAAILCTTTLFGFAGRHSWFLDLFSHFRVQYLVNNNPFLRIPLDHVLHSPDIVVLQRTIGPDVKSDHFPVIVDLAVPQQSAATDSLSKIEFDLNILDKDGLRGPSDGKVAISYEFCIPDNDACRAEVKAIDPTVQFMPGSRGRIGAGKDECLCIGSTHQKNFKEVLRKLSEKSYIARIIECHFE